MNRRLVVLSVSLALVSCASHAQDMAALSFNPNNKVWLEQTEESVASVVDCSSPGLQAIAVPSVSGLRALMFDNSFSRLVILFTRFVKEATRRLKPLYRQLLYRLNFILSAARRAHIPATPALPWKREPQMVRDAREISENPDIVKVP